MVESKSSSGRRSRRLVAALAAVGCAYLFVYSESPDYYSSGLMPRGLSASTLKEGDYRSEESRRPIFESREALEKYEALLKTLKIDDFEPVLLPPFTQKVSREKGEQVVPLNELRKNLLSSFNYTWQDHYDMVTDAGHEWCSLIRDRYTCHGDIYHEVLKRTPPFDVDRYGLLQTLPPGSKVLLHGNSFTFELILPAMCALGSNGFGYKLSPKSNTFLIFSDRNVDEDTIVLLLVDNHPTYAEGETGTADNLVSVLKDKHPWFEPTHVVAGMINFLFPSKHKGAAEMCQDHRDTFQRAWPSANVVNRCDFTTGMLGCSCASDGDHNCEYVCYMRPGKHQCLPGPGTIAMSQSLVHDLMLPSGQQKQQQADAVAQDEKAQTPAATVE